MRRRFSSAILSIFEYYSYPFTKSKFKVFTQYNDWLHGIKHIRLAIRVTDFHRNSQVLKDDVAILSYVCNSKLRFTGYHERFQVGWISHRALGFFLVAVKTTYSRYKYVKITFYMECFIFKTMPRTTWTVDLKRVQPVVKTTQTPSFRFTVLVLSSMVTVAKD